jgi:hypothetical protein
MQDSSTSLFSSPCNCCSDDTLRCPNESARIAGKTCRAYAWCNHIDDYASLAERECIGESAHRVHFDKLGESISAANISFKRPDDCLVYSPLVHDLFLLLIEAFKNTGLSSLAQFFPSSRLESQPADEEDNSRVRVVSLHGFHQDGRK